MKIKRNIMFAIIALIVIAAVIGLWFTFGTNDATDTTTTTTKTTTNTGGSGVVTIVEYSDFQCPFCARAQPTITQVKETYGDQIEIIYKHFPLGFHDNAQIAAEASECANEQGKFWEYHDMIFANQAALSESNLKTWAGDLKLDTEQFDACLDSGKYTDKVKQDMQEGKDAGVSGTPTFIINGQKLVGAQPFEAFKQIIDAELAK